MKRDIAMMVILFSLSSLGLGMVIGLRISAARPAEPVANSSVTVAPSQTTPQQTTNPPDSPDDFDCVDLPHDYPIRTRFNGKRLPLNYAGLEKGEERQLLKDAKA